MAHRRENTGLMDEVLTIRMHTKVTKGGRNLSFAALVAVGNGNGRVGIGYGKAPGVPMAIEKGNKKARDNMMEVPLVGDTVCHRQIGQHKASEVLLRPAAPGTGVKAGSTVRSIMQVAGVRNVLTKSLGRNNPINLARATMNALQEMRSVQEAQELRGTEIRLRHPQLGIEEQKKEAAEQSEEEQPPAETEEPEAQQEPEAAPSAPAEADETTEESAQEEAPPGPQEQPEPVLAEEEDEEETEQEED